MQLSLFVEPAYVFYKTGKTDAFSQASLTDARDQILGKRIVPVIIACQQETNI